MAPSFTSVEIGEFDKHFGSSIELSLDSLGSSIVAVSDQWFAPATSLLKQNPPSNLSGQFGPNGALYDGWESRRHNPAYDWVIIQLGVPSGKIIGFDVDTTFFNGNQAPACSVYGLSRPGPPPNSPNDPDWQELLPVCELGPSSRHLFKITETTQGYRYIKLHMIPDGGIARFRVYGHPIPVFPAGTFDLASVLLGARVVFTSDQHYGVGSNLILPGRGPENMDGGWETKRSRKPGHSDFVIIKLAEEGFLETAEIDTNYFIGNSPQHIDLFATVSDQNVPNENSKWTEILEKSKLVPHHQQYFQLSRPQEKFTHVRMTIYPDGGVKRVRLYGARAVGVEETLEATKDSNGTSIFSIGAYAADQQANNPRRVRIIPLTGAALEPYGTVIEASMDPASINGSKKVNFGTATKLDHVARVEPTAEVDEKLPGNPNFCLFSCNPWQPDYSVPSIPRKAWKLKGLERHQFSSQTFIPFTAHFPTSDQAERDQLNTQPEGMYLIVVALDNNGKPDLDTLKAFLGVKSQGISYYKNIWHAPLIAINNRMDFTCLVYETGDPKTDCELVETRQIFIELDDEILPSAHGLNP